MVVPECGPSVTSSIEDESGDVKGAQISFSLGPAYLKWLKI